ncbi:MAG: Eco57I restriction-modification methylase domain-containing protein [Sedimentisphaerales bacterium]|nr:Eco57I restriction-modification methylase domain-containing protein [Sedimentisphaerales bacterium]
MQTCVIKLTKASEKYGNLNIRPCGKDFFPEDAFGSYSKKTGLGAQIMLKAEGLTEPIRTDIPTDKATGQPRWIFRERKWLKEFLRSHSLGPGDELVIHRLDARTYDVGPARFARQLELFENALRPVVYAHNLAQKYIEGTPVEHRKKNGQYFTPPEVADFMADLAEVNGRSAIRVLDPGAGTGILSCAVCERLGQIQGLSEIELDVYETDPCLLAMLDEVLAHLTSWLDRHGVSLKCRVLAEDFALSAAELADEFRPYDVVLSNPPYKKIAGDDPRSRLARGAVCGQPNLYALFMLAAAKMLRRSGSMVFITPRSYMAGCYFKAFRQAFFRIVQPIRAHLFESRKDVFSNQKVLQENVILESRKGVGAKSIIVSHSHNAKDLEHSVLNKVPLAHALHMGTNGMVLRLPVDELDDLVVEIVDSWTNTLVDYGLEISTGPVVPFRAKEFITSNGRSAKATLVPLLWMRNVQPMQTVWPCGCPDNRDAANQFIVANSETHRRKLLVPPMNMILLRRFSVKEEKRRLTAAPLFAGTLDSEWIGLENHLNYIRRPRGKMTQHETIGLAVLLNSSLIDRYFRICNGNTQVGAAEIRAIPLPSLDIIVQLGKLFDRRVEREVHERLDSLVWKMVRPFCRNQKLLERMKH